MFNKIIDFFKTIFKDNICSNREDLLSKLQCMRKQDSFNPYDPNLKGIKVKCPEKNIFLFLEELKKVMKLDLDNEYVRIKKYRTDLMFEINIAEFFTNDGYMISNYEEVWNDFLNTSIDLIIWVYNAEKMNNNIYKDVNSRFLKSYIIYIDTLVSELILNLEERRKLK